MSSRAAAQLLHRPGLGGVVEVVRHLLAVQAQDTAAYPLAFRARMNGVTAAEVAAVREERSVVRCWGPRGTLHLVAVEDLEWLHPLVRVSAAGPLRRLRELGAPTSAEDAVARVGKVLRGQGPLTKAELGERLGAEGQVIIHLAALAAREGMLVLGPDVRGKATYVHAADWLGAPLPTTVDEGKALGELALRYQRAHAEAKPEDLAVWSGLPLGAARRAWRDVPDPEPAGPLVRLLPAFDEYLLGWKERAVPAEHRTAINRGGGIIRPTVIVDGRIAGTWQGSDVAFFGEPADVAAELADIERFRASLPGPGFSGGWSRPASRRRPCQAAR